MDYNDNLACPNHSFNVQVSFQFANDLIKSFHFVLHGEFRNVMYSKYNDSYFQKIKV